MNETHASTTAGPATALALPSRRRTYGTVVGAGFAVLVLGLLVPFIVADPADDRVDTAGIDLPDELTGAEPPLGTATPGSDDGTGAADGPQDSGGSTATTNPGGGSPDGAGTGGSGDGNGNSNGPNGPDEPRRASDVGITAEEIKVGILVPTADFGGGDATQAIGDVQALWQAHIDAVNAAGGAQGRQLVPVYREYDGLSADAMRAACVFLTENAEVFAVLSAGGFYGDPILCITEQHQTPYIGQDSGIAESFQRSNGLQFSMSMLKERTLLNFVARMEAAGLLRGRTIGVLDRAGIDQIPVSSSLIPALERLGYSVTHRATITDDFAVAQSQIPLEVQEMQRKGVDLVLPATGFTHGVLFAHNAESQNYRPTYALSDFAGGATDIYGLGMPASFDNAIGFTSLRTGEGRAGLPESATDAACRQRAEAGLGRGITRDTGEYSSAVFSCGILDAFVAGMNRAGVNPTRPEFASALANLGTFAAPYSGASSFFPGKTDAPDVIRRVRWDYDCRCWTPQSDFVRAEF